MWKKTDKESVVVLLQRNQLSFFRDSSGKTATFPFDQKIVDDLEIKDENAFCKSLSNFLLLHKLNAASVIVVLDSSVYFSQQIKSTNTEENLKKQLELVEQSEKKDKKEQIKEEETDSETENQKRVFAQSVPFANVFSTVTTVGKDKFFLALNRDFYEPVIKVFSERELRVVAILPMMVVHTLFETAGFTPESATTLITTLDKYHEQNFLESSLKKIDTTAVTALPTNDSDKKRLILMVIVFVVLMGVLAVVILWSQKRDQQLAQVALPVPGPSVAPVITPSPTVQPTPVATLSELLQASSSGQISAVEYEVTVINASGDTADLNNLIEQLESAGFTNIVQRTEASTLTGNMPVSVSSDIPTVLLEALEEQLLEWGYQPTFKTEPELTNSIEITLTNQ